MEPVQHSAGRSRPGEPGLCHLLVLLTALLREASRGSRWSNTTSYEAVLCVETVLMFPRLSQVQGDGTYHSQGSVFISSLARVSVPLLCVGRWQLTLCRGMCLLRGCGFLSVHGHWFASHVRFQDLVCMLPMQPRPHS